MKNFFRKVAFGLKPDEKAPSDPLTWAFIQNHMVVKSILIFLELIRQEKF